MDEPQISNTQDCSWTKYYAHNCLLNIKISATIIIHNQVKLSLNIWVEIIDIHIVELYFLLSFTNNITVKEYRKFIEHQFPEYWKETGLDTLNGMLLMVHEALVHFSLRLFKNENYLIRWIRRKGLAYQINSFEKI